MNEKGYVQGTVYPNQANIQGWTRMAHMVMDINGDQVFIS